MSSGVCWDPDRAEALYLDSLSQLEELGLLDEDIAARFRGEIFAAQVTGDEELHDLVSRRLHRHARLLNRLSLLTHLAASALERHDPRLFEAVTEAMRVLARQGFDSLRKDGVQDDR